MPSADVIDEAISGIFARPEFAQRQNITERILDFIRGILEKLNLSFGPEDSWPMLAVAALVLLLAVAAVILIVIRIGVYIVRNRGFRSSIKGANGKSLTLDEAREMAMQAAAYGEYRDAVRYLFLFFLLKMASIGMIRWSESRTNSQYVREMAANGFPRVDMVKEIIREFNAVVYGGKPMDGRAWTDWRIRVESLSEEGARQ